MPKTSRGKRNIDKRLGAEIHVHKSEQDCVTQTPLFKTVQLHEINYVGVGHIMQSNKALCEPSLNIF